MRVDRFNSAICHIPFNGVESFFIWNKKKRYRAAKMSLRYLKRVRTINWTR